MAERSEGWLSVREAAEIAKVGEGFIRYLVRTNRIAHKRLKVRYGNRVASTVHVRLPEMPLDALYRRKGDRFEADGETWVSARCAAWTVHVNGREETRRIPASTITKWRHDRKCQWLPPGEVLRVKRRGAVNYFALSQLQAIWDAQERARRDGWKGVGPVRHFHSPCIVIAKQRFISFGEAQRRLGMPAATISGWKRKKKCAWLKGRRSPTFRRLGHWWYILEAEVAEIVAVREAVRRAGWPGGKLPTGFAEAVGSAAPIHEAGASPGRVRDSSRSAQAREPDEVLAERNDWLLEQRCNTELTDAEVLQKLKRKVREEGKRWPLFSDLAHFRRTMKEWARHRGKDLPRKNPGRRRK